MRDARQERSRARFHAGVLPESGGPLAAWLGAGRWATAVLLAAVLLPSSAAFAWGARTHEIINRRAVEDLPGPAGAAWAPLARQLGAHASDADHRKGSDPNERPRHFIDIDAFAQHPFTDVPRTMPGMVRKYGAEEAVKWGVAPWAIGECYRMTVLSLQRGDWASAGAWAADLGHYVADTHQPLHCTMNYDGQKSGHDGVHLRFEVAMMDRHYEESSITPPPADFRSAHGDPVAFCFDWIAEAYPGLDAILAGDEVARTVDPQYGPPYLAALWEETHEVARSQVDLAVRDLGALYRAAWEEAGSPAPPEVIPPFRALPVDVLDPPEAPRGGRSAWGAVLVAGGVIVAAVFLGAR